MPRLFRHPTDPVAGPEYVVLRATDDAAAMLDDDVAAWRAAASIAWGADEYRTAFRAVWTDEAMIVRFECTDREPWWTITGRDGHLWEEEVAEIFVDPVRRGRHYAEVEISPANVVCDLRVRTPWPALSSDTAWDWTALQSRVDMRSGQPGGAVVWTARLVLPFAGLASLCDEAAQLVPPKRGDRWKFNVFRIKRPAGPADPERGAIYAAWSVPDGPSFHDPERFRDLVFA